MLCIVRYFNSPLYVQLYAELHEVTPVTEDRAVSMVVIIFMCVCMCIPDYFVIRLLVISDFAQCIYF